MISIIPAIDLIDGKCVRLSQGSFDEVRRYDTDPVDMARQFELHGCKRLHLVDLDGARQGKVVNWRQLEKIAAATGLLIDFSGGIRSQADIESAFNSGAHQVTLGSIAVTARDSFNKWLFKYGRERIVLAADFSERMVRIGGWKEDTRTDLFEFLAEYDREGIKYVICTDIEKDGMLSGPEIDTYAIIKKIFPCFHLIASGGVSSIDDVRKLSARGINGVIIGKAFYEGYLKIEELKEFLC
jgi:phosphoribosylformimino-5-aminoimidazole carboxamide ribotide isomerase